MDCKEIQEILDKYKISNINQLDTILKTDFNSKEKISYATGNERALCFEVDDFTFFVPDCRKIYEIYKKFYEVEYNTKNSFAQYILDLYIEDDTPNKKKLGLQSIIGYLSCRNCDPTKKKVIKNDILKDIICNALDIKLNKEKVFNTYTQHIDEFLELLVSETSGTMKEPYKQQKENNKEMNKEEKEKFFKVAKVSRMKFKTHLSNLKNIEGSDEYKINLAFEAFNRNLDDEALEIIKILDQSGTYENDIEYLQLKAKLHSNKKNDKEAIEIYNKLIDIQLPNLFDAETHNLLAASIKREAFNQWYSSINQDEEIEQLVDGFKKSKKIYQKVFDINKDYYPAINIIYIEMMLAYIEALSSKEIEEKIEELKSFWCTVKLDEKDYWSRISNIEFLIVTKQYEKAKEKIDIMMQELDEEEISEFMSFATSRQMEMFKEFYSDKELTQLLQYLIFK